MPTMRRAASPGIALTLATSSFALCFACWVINAVLVAHLLGSRVFAWSDVEVGWLLALPFFTGAITRVPLGILTDRYGGRAMFVWVLLLSAASLLALSFAEGFASFALASLGVGIAGGSFAVGTGYVCVWFEPKRQGTALGVFGTGTAGPALTLLLAPQLLVWLTEGGQTPEGWRWLPRLYAGVLIGVALVFWLYGGDRRSAGKAAARLNDVLAPLRDVVVWRFGLYYLLVFGGAVAMTQWIVPYGVNAYGLSLAEAGMLAALVSAPSGLIKVAGGWISDRFGAGPVMMGVFAAIFAVGLLLGIPRMDIESPGEGVSARVDGDVERVAADEIVVEGVSHAVLAPAAQPLRPEQVSGVLPRVVHAQQPLVQVGQTVRKRELIASGVTHVLYPANLPAFSALLLAFALACGIGMAGVLKFIPERFPHAVGAVGGLVGLLGALGGFVLPLLFSGALRFSGLWTSCFWILALLALICLLSLYWVRRRIVSEEAPELVRLIERAASTPLPSAQVGLDSSLEDLLLRVPLFCALSAAERSVVAGAGSLRTVAAGETIFEQGDPGDALYVVISGSVEVNRDGLRIARFESGAHFGELALLDGGQRSASARVLQPGLLFVLPRAQFLHRLAQSPRMLAHLLVGLSQRLRASGPASLERVEA